MAQFIDHHDQPWTCFTLHHCKYQKKDIKTYTNMSIGRQYNSYKVQRQGAGQAYIFSGRKKVKCGCVSKENISVLWKIGVPPLLISSCQSAKLTAAQRERSVQTSVPVVCSPLMIQLHSSLGLILSFF